MPTHSPDPKALQKLIRDSSAVVEQALRQAHLGQAWQLLQERDAEGNPKGPLPYTPEALVELQRAYQHDRENLGLIHHLAVALHAYAWDLEIAGDPRAAAAWESALGHWRTLANSPEFWAGLKTRYLTCDPKGDAEFLDEARKNLLEQLLDIHVDFVRHYCEASQYDRAVEHVRIIQRAKLPPVFRKQMVLKVFSAMTSSVPDALQRSAFEASLGSVERFLSIFTEHVSGLRMHLEGCTAWLKTLSYDTDWDAILTLSQRSEPRAEQLVSQLLQDEDPLAKVALEELGQLFILRSIDRGSPDLRDNPEAARLAYDLGLRWGLLIERLPRPSGELVSLYGISLHNHAVALWYEAIGVANSAIDEARKNRTKLRLLRQAVAEMEGAVQRRPEDVTMSGNLKTFQEELTKQEGDCLFKQLGDLDDTDDDL